jgi:hypothetical protein
MHIAKALFETNDRLAIGVEAEVAGLDDAGMDRANWNLVKRRPLCRMERIWHTIGRDFVRLAERMFYAPAAVIEPRAVIRTALRRQAMKIANRALEAQGRRMGDGNGGEASIWT